MFIVVALNLFQGTLDVYSASGNFLIDTICNSLLEGTLLSKYRQSRLDYINWVIQNTAAMGAGYFLM